jgi:hypothetical protein
MESIFHIQHKSQVLNLRLCQYLLRLLETDFGPVRCGYHSRQLPLALNLHFSLRSGDQRRYHKTDFSTKEQVSGLCGLLRLQVQHHPRPHEMGYGSMECGFPIPLQFLAQARLPLRQMAYQGFGLLERILFSQHSFQVHSPLLLLPTASRFLLS